MLFFLLSKENIQLVGNLSDALAFEMAAVVLQNGFHFSEIVHENLIGFPL